MKWWSGVYEVVRHLQDWWLNFPLLPVCRGVCIYQSTFQRCNFEGIENRYLLDNAFFGGLWVFFWWKEKQQAVYPNEKEGGEVTHHKNFLGLVGTRALSNHVLPAHRLLGGHCIAVPQPLAHALCILWWLWKAGEPRFIASHSAQAWGWGLQQPCW